MQSYGNSRSIGAPICRGSRIAIICLNLVVASCLQNKTHPSLPEQELQDNQVASESTPSFSYITKDRLSYQRLSEIKARAERSLHLVIAPQKRGKIAKLFPLRATQTSDGCLSLVDNGRHIPIEDLDARSTQDNLVFVDDTEPHTLGLSEEMDILVGLTASALGAALLGGSALAARLAVKRKLAGTAITDPATISPMKTPTAPLDTGSPAGRHPQNRRGLRPSDTRPSRDAHIDALLARGEISDARYLELKRMANEELQKTQQTDEIEARFAQSKPVVYVDSVELRHWTPATHIHERFAEPASAAEWSKYFSDRFKESSTTVRRTHRDGIDRVRKGVAFDIPSAGSQANPRLALVLSAKLDHSGALGLAPKARYGQLLRDHHLRGRDVGSVDEIIQQAREFAGSSGKINFLELSTHGDIGSLWLSAGLFRTNKLSVGESRISELSSYLADDAVIVLSSCSAGACIRVNPNLADTFARALPGRRIVAPTEPVAGENEVMLEPSGLLGLRQSEAGSGQSLRYVAQYRDPATFEFQGLSIPPGYQRGSFVEGSVFIDGKWQSWSQVPSGRANDVVKFMDECGYLYKETERRAIYGAFLPHTVP